jgi:serine/threonine-protein kinase
MPGHAPVRAEPPVDRTMHDPIPAGSEVPIEMDELERVTLVDLPALARYGRYELLGRLAYGGMAEIFLAREAHVSAQRLLVLKRVLPHVAEDQHFVDMFVDEARLAMQLNHPNICHVYSFGQEEGTFYIAMEWVNGKTLSKIIRKAREQGGLPVPVALKIVAQVAEALDYAHRACDAAGEPLGIVHRDVSPQNIMVSYDGVVKLLDFGIAKATSHSTRTEAGVIKGKFAYMSPQQCVGEPIDSRADIFALGVCLFEALTGKNPFRRQSEFETMTRIVGDPTPLVREKRPDVPEEVEQILQLALMKQPERRYQTAGDMQLALETVLPKLGMPINASRIGEYVSKLFGDEVREGPQLDMRLSIGPVRSGPTGSADESREAASLPPRLKPPGSTELDAVPLAREVPVSATVEPAKKKSGLGPATIAIFLVLVTGLCAVGGLLAVVLMKPDVGDDLVGRAPTPAPSPGTTTPVGTPPLVAEPTAPEVPDPGAPVPATAGSVFVSSVPSGASITFGDRGTTGTTPMEIGMVQPGTYDVRLTLDGHDAWSGQVQVTAGQRVTVNAQLQAQAEEDRPRERPVVGPPGELSLNTQPWSKVYLGNRLLGTTPIGRVSVPSGMQRLRLVDRDGTEHRRTVRVPPGGHVTESFNLRE